MSSTATVRRPLDGRASISTSWTAASSQDIANRTTRGRKRVERRSTSSSRAPSTLTIIRPRVGPVGPTIAIDRVVPRQTSFDPPASVESADPAE